MKLPLKIGILLSASVAILLLLICYISKNFSTDSRSIPMQDVIEILTVSRIQKRDGEIIEHTTSGEDLDSSLSTSVIDCLGRYSMTTRPVSSPDTMIMTDPYDHISIWLLNADSTTMRINVSNVQSYCNVDYEGEHYGIPDSVSLLQDLDSLLGNR